MPTPSRYLVSAQVVLEGGIVLKKKCLVRSKDEQLPKTRKLVRDLILDVANPRADSGILLPGEGRMILEIEHLAWFHYNTKGTQTYSCRTYYVGEGDPPLALMTNMDREVDQALSDYHTRRKY